MTQVEVADLHKTYANTPALKGVSLSARDGELVTLLGPSGCGKTTTLRCIAGFMAPDAGDIRIDGTSILRQPPARRDFGIVFQNYALFPHLTVAENVAYGLQVRRIGKEEARQRVAEVLERVSLKGLEDRLPRALSGGQQQRVALARALVIRPRLLLLDEPLANLDAQLRQEVRGLIRRIQQEQRITAFYVTHDQAEAMAISDRVAVMQNGRVAQFATPREIYQRPAQHFVARFTGEASCLPARVAAAAGPGRYRVETAAGTVEAEGPDGLGAGAARLMMLRPEALSLAASGGLAATVRSCAFLGATQQCDVLAGDTPLRLFVPPNATVPVGEAVHIAVDPEHAWLMQDDAP